MEFDNNTSQTPSISDEQRRLAESKKLTLEPIHSDVMPEDVSDMEISSRHVNSPAIKNIDNDIEQDAPLIEPSKSFLQRRANQTQHSSHLTLVVSICVAVVSLTLVTVFMLNK